MKPAVEWGGGGAGRVMPPYPSPAPISQLMAISCKDDVNVIFSTCSEFCTLKIQKGKCEAHIKRFSLDPKTSIHACRLGIHKKNSVTNISSLDTFN
jgi:hypothetical protein